MFSALVYVMCALTSGLCAARLYRNYRKSGTRMLLWSSACFSLLAFNNLILSIDLILAPQADLSVIRTLPAVAGFAVLLWGFIWDMT